jgi:hypothetical protein
MTQNLRWLGRALGLASALWLVTVTGCSSAAPANSGAQLGATELHFSLEQCQPLGPNLWKCPAIDKPICSPDYVGTDVQCVRVDKSGKVIVQQMQL